MATSTAGTNNAASKMFLLAAVALGVLATVLAFGFINNAGAGGGPQIKIVIAKRDLPPDSVLDPDRDLQTENIPDRSEFRAFAHLTLDPATLANYKGQRVNRRIPAGQPVFLADIAAYGVLELKPPYRALPIQAEAGIAIPGDWVQVLVTNPNFSAGAGAAGAAMPTGATFAAGGKAFRVISVAGALFRTRSAVMAADVSSGTANSAKVVELEVTDADALDIVSALGSGLQKATLVICPAPATATAPQ